jgi:ABC-type branched-subunit amino acid transport system substrate-binding protein
MKYPAAIVFGIVALAFAASAAAGHRSTGTARVVVSHGQPVQIAFADDLTGFGAPFGPDAENAIRLAIVAHPTVHGFPIQLNVVNAPCGDPAADVAAAAGIVANTQNAGVLGQFCSSGFDQSLPIYQAAGVVVVSGSATSDALPAFGPTVFDRTAVSDGDGGTAWYTQVASLPADLAWQGAYAALFGAPPAQFADLYGDAARVLLRSLRDTSWVDNHGNLVVDRAALARAVRHTKDARGITCTITIDPATGNRVNDLKALARCAG